MTSKSQRVYVRSAPGGNATSMLEEILEAAAFWDLIARIQREQSKSPEQFSIAIKPDIDVFSVNFPSGTDSHLVGHLATLLQAHGYSNIAVIDARNCRDSWLLNREPLLVADVVGYDFSEALYQVVGDDDAALSADYWRAADFRINFAKNRTHESFSYALAVHNLLGLGDLGSNAEAASQCLGVLRDAPPHFNLIDAFVSFHGAAGERAPVAYKTCTLIASTDALSVDIVGATKMALDPYLSPINARCMNVLGMPALHTIEGGVAPYPMWQNVHPLVAETARRRNESPGLGGASAAWFQTVDREHFPFREFYSDRINSFIAPLMARIGKDPRAQWLVVLLNTLIVSVSNGIQAQHTLFAKDKLAQHVKPIESDLTQFSDADYLCLPFYLQTFENLMGVDGNAADRMRLRRLDDATLFYAEYEFPVNFDEFVEHVNIGHSIQYMNDYIGGSRQTISADKQQRVCMQAERNVYLQQPNWMVLFGGDVIDVEKIELIEYGQNQQSIYWRTIASPNDSAQFDDGRVTFKRSSNNCARVQIFTRQKFSLPLFFHITRIDLFPGIRDPIVEAGYKNFFDRTIANMMATYEQREYRIGYKQTGTKLNTENSLSDISRYFATALATLSELLRNKGDIAGVGEWFAARSWTQSVLANPTEDSNGFRHFGATASGTRYDRAEIQNHDYLKRLEAVVSDSPGLFAGLATAVQRDFEAFAENNNGSEEP